jgi:hypothetical protein
MTLLFGAGRLAVDQHLALIYDRRVGNRGVVDRDARNREIGLHYR